MKQQVFRFLSSNRGKWFIKRTKIHRFSSEIGNLFTEEERNNIAFKKSGEIWQVERQLNSRFSGCVIKTDWETFKQDFLRILESKRTLLANIAKTRDFLEDTEEAFQEMIKSREHSERDIKGIRLQRIKLEDWVFYSRENFWDSFESLFFKLHPCCFEKQFEERLFSQCLVRSR